MPRISIALFLVFGGLLCACSTQLIAQSSSCYDVMSIVWINYFPPYPGWNCAGDGSGDPVGIVICTRSKSSCPPPHSPQETACGCNTPPSPKAPQTSCEGGRTINLAGGNTYISQRDVSIPGLGGGLQITRTWNSMWPSSQSGSIVGLFGLRWRSTYEERVFLDSDSYMKYSRADGSFWSFGYDSATSKFQLVAPGNDSMSLVNESATDWVLTFKNGEKRVFSYATGSLLSITDRNGNLTQLSYDGANRLTTITDAAGRHLYFGYGNGSSYLVVSVTSDFGVSLTYSFDNQQRLTQVTKPDNTNLNFEYDGQSLITAVKDSAGKVLESHSYDSSGRGLTSSRADGVESVTVSYSQ